MDHIRKYVLKEISTSFMGIRQSEMDELVKSVLKAERIFLYGERREDIPMRGFCMRLNHLGLTAYHIGDVYTPDMKQGDLLLVSRTFSHPPVAEVYMKAAGQAGAKVIVLTDSVENQGNAQADSTVIIPLPHADGQPASLQPRGALYDQVLWLTLDYAELLLQSFVGGDENQRVSRHANIL